MEAILTLFLVIFGRFCLSFGPLEGIDEEGEEEPPLDSDEELDAAMDNQLMEEPDGAYDVLSGFDQTSPPNSG